MDSDSLDKSLELLRELCSALEAIPIQLKEKRLHLYSELTAIKSIVQYQQRPLSQGRNIVLRELHSHLALMATKLELYSINQNWPFGLEEQQNILLTLSRLKLALLSLSDASTVSADRNGMNDALDNNPIQRHSRPGRTLHFGMQGNYIESAGGPVLSNNIINEADPAVGQSINRLHDREDDKERVKQHGEFLQWISPLDFHSTQATTFARYTVGTGTWLLQDSRFLDWLLGSVRFLWCPGNPGVGKTILASVIIDHLQRSVVTPEDVVIYIYCEYNRKAEQTSMQLLGSILKQLVERRPAISQHLLSLYKIHSSRKTMPTFPELMDALRTELQSYTRAYLIVDALDECSDEARDFFLSTGSPAGLRSLTDNLQLLMTSRNMPSITHALKVQGESTLHIEAHVEDLQIYIRRCLVGVRRLNRLVKDDKSLEDKIIEVVISKAAGMFLQAKLHLDSLARQTNVKTLRNALDRLPEDIWRSYDNAMLRIDAQGETDSNLAYHIFYWLSCSKRPLTVPELQHAVAVSSNPEMTDMEQEAIVDIETLTDVCAGLIITDKSFTRSRLTVRLVHYTMQEYLQLNQQRLFPTIHSLMAITCLTYMSFNTFSTEEWKVSSRHRLSTQYPLYEYAVLFWGKHAWDNQEQIFPHVQRFLKKPVNVARASKLFRRRRYFLSQLSSHILYLPIVFSLVQVLEKLLPDHDMGPADGGLLLLASLLGHAEIVMVLLTKVDPNTQDVQLRTALSYSAEYGSLKSVQILLKLKGIHPDLPDKDGRTPFIHACHHGHTEIVQLFLDQYNINYNFRDHNGWTALFHAVDQKHLDIAQVLLQHSDIQPDIPDNTEKTPLIWAAQQSAPSWTYLKLMEALLEREDVNPDSQDEHLRTALSYSAGGNLKNTSLRYDQVLCLLKNGATPDLQDRYLRTPLSYAIERRQSRIITLLLENPAVDRYAPNLYLHTPIWSPNAERLLKEYSELKKNHLTGKSDTKFLLDSSQPLIAASLAKVRDEGAWAWGFHSPQTQDQYTNNLDVLFLEMVTPDGGGFHGSIHNSVHGTQTQGFVSITTLSSTTNTCLLSNLPLVGGRYIISPNKQGVYYEVRVLEMEDAVAVGLACRPYPAWCFVGWNRLSAAWHLDNMEKHFETWKGKEYLPGTCLQNGDVVGVGFIHSTGTLFFTLNGSRLPDAFTGIFLPHSKHDLFAAIGMREKAMVEINFGAEKFMWSEGNEWAWSVEGVFNVLDHSEEGSGQSDEL